ncbi:hypothetical protein COT44_00975 [Candidatus Shapirobacteria bacterium CG08_land_8_20_14_0_20_39_18]|uniref:Glycosyltransferase RgtA/B/C/D-like domain-containing protein n=1 Tax=Candidatus Shapirobacteria bacterium CG08_land_8_20_14_0_20_39_18 TaxID=1974883 RepID=A0A2M6XDU6_9BACT|nr:MAG: hypothetical protein COT44_00975 [Candidatus Shapirobacteria bacterium CG08_land_8_20_14_0_20_39_18]PJE68623.1 MAG: hypothetical protein COU94_01050 [Candidatus Shapirobacteria bacterium CG10_big_fil_rev_8_21_14_0_10_38_8]
MAKNYQKKILKNFSLIFFVLIGVFFRLFNLGLYPRLYNQEALVGWRAESILLTSKDELGRFLPLIFSSMSGYKFPFQTYFTAPFIRIFGLNEFAIRFPIALVGIASIFCFYQLLKHYFDNIGSIYSNITAFIFIIPFLFISGFYFKNRKWIITGLILILFSLPLYLNYFRSPGILLDLQVNKFSLLSDVTLSNSINTLREEKTILADLIWSEKSFIIKPSFL